MTHFFQSTLVVCAFIMAAAVSAGEAAVVYEDVITEGEVGSGANQTMIVIDWDTGFTPSHAWLFSYNDSATFADAYNAIAEIEPDFTWSESAFVDHIHYHDGVDDHLSEAPGWLSFWESQDGADWSPTTMGVFDQPLIADGFAGTNANLEAGVWPGDAPTTPTIPEPTTAMLLTGAAAAMLRRRPPRSVDRVAHRF